MYLILTTQHLPRVFLFKMNKSPGPGQSLLHVVVFNVKRVREQQPHYDHCIIHLNFYVHCTTRTVLMAQGMTGSQKQHYGTPNFKV